jgi:hypothetical protein
LWVSKAIVCDVLNIAVLNIERQGLLHTLFHWSKKTVETERMWARIKKGIRRPGCLLRFVYFIKCMCAPSMRKCSDGIRVLVS